jgi:DnaJ family protein C protein 9
LSDESKRKLYDSNGSLDVDDNISDGHWYEYFRSLYPKVTIEKIKEFTSNYIGSQEEYDDVVAAYNQCKGDLFKMIENFIMCAELDRDEQRICNVVDTAFKNGDLKETSKYKHSLSKLASCQKKKPSKKKSSEAEADFASLAMAIQSKRSNSSMQSILNKYGDTDDAYDNISDEAFEKTKSGIMQNKKIKK